MQSGIRAHRHMKRKWCSRTATHSIVTNDGVNVSHGVVASILRSSDGDGARITLLVDLDIGPSAPLQLLDSVALLTNDTTHHRPRTGHRLTGSEPILQVGRRQLSQEPIPAQIHSATQHRTFWMTD